MFRCTWNIFTHWIQTWYIELISVRYIVCKEVFKGKIRLQQVKGVFWLLCEIAAELVSFSCSRQAAGSSQHGCVMSKECWTRATVVTTA